MVVEGSGLDKEGDGYGEETCDVLMSANLRSLSLSPLVSQPPTVLRLRLQGAVGNCLQFLGLASK